MWECSKCGLVRARRQGSLCEDGENHDWWDSEELSEAREKEKRELEEAREREKRELKEAREREKLREAREQEEKEAAYQKYINSQKGKLEIAKLASEYKNNNMYRLVTHSKNTGNIGIVLSFLLFGTCVAWFLSAINIIKKPGYILVGIFITTVILFIVLVNILKGRPSFYEDSDNEETAKDDIRSRYFPDDEEGDSEYEVDDEEDEENE